MSDPMRTCVGCRKHAPRAELLRIVLDRSCVPVALSPDPGACHPGRGAWVHPTLECCESAIRRKAFTRALRQPGTCDAEALRAFVARASSAGEQLESVKGGLKADGHTMSASK